MMTKAERSRLNALSDHEQVQSVIENITEIYDQSQTRDILARNDFYKTLFGRGKSRTLKKSDPKLYKSIMCHSKILEETLKSQSTAHTQYNFSHRLKFIVDLNYNMDKLKCDCGEKYNWTNYCRQCPEPKRTFLGKRHRKSTKRKQRLAAINRLHNQKGGCCPNYNVNSISIIEQYGRDHGYNFQHAENGGEYHIKELGYYLDGYDVDKNVAIEYDERAHFKSDGTLKKRDVDRQKEIEAYLGCTFIRIRYDDKKYKI